jgi:pyridoxamine 5'-phosphate oxidase
MRDPLEILGSWLQEARDANLPAPTAMTLVTATVDGRPSARTVSLKRLESDALVFTTALWTRKAREIESNPQIALLFHWPTFGRQAHITGRAVPAERALAEELFAERDLAHRFQTIVSRQGERIDALDPLRDRLRHLTDVQETVPGCPQDWGALRVHPDSIELWSEAPDRLHDRLLYERVDDGCVAHGCLPEDPLLGVYGLW